MADQLVPEERNMGNATDSFNIFQASVAMCSIFLGFVFAALLHLLTSAPIQTWAYSWLIWLLVTAMLLLAASLLSFHATAHQVIRHWRSFYPNSKVRIFGSFAFQLGVLTMLWSVAVLLWGCSIWMSKMLSVIVTLSSLGIFPYSLWLRNIHRGQPYIKDVGKSQ